MTELHPSIVVPIRLGQEDSPDSNNNVNDEVLMSMDAKILVHRL